MNANRKQVHLGRVLFLLSGVFLCSFYQLTTSERLNGPLSMSQNFGENSTEGIVETLVEPGDLEEPLNATDELQPTEMGWVILHIIGIMYMFVSLGIVCNEFFVPALWVITNKLAISNDVAGAIVMAAGRSSPKFFMALIAPIRHSNVGSIVGSAVYNILFVTGICALFSREVLHLTRWPLFRDVSFYILHLILLIIFFLDSVIPWWESMMLVAGYTLYVVFMTFNTQIVQTFRTHKDKGTVKVVALEETKKERVGLEDPGNDEDYSKKRSVDDENDVNQEEEGKKSKPLSLKWPDTRYKQAIYLFLLPIALPLWLTVPDVRNQKSRKFYLITFFVSILWINVFFYFMVWWAHRVGETIGITEEIMGLTVLAAGTSIPDLVTSVIVARKGLGDMAVSSSVGKNIFDITVGLPVPWLLYSSSHGFAEVAVSSDGLFCAFTLLFFMLLCFIISVASCKWKMNKVLGFTMLLLYIIFVVICVSLQYRIIACPV